jgi:hypothetical protein
MYAVEIGSGAMVYIPSFIKIGSGIQKLMGRGVRGSQTRRQNSDLVKPTFIFLNEESRPKIHEVHVLYKHDKKLHLQGCPCKLSR